MSKKILSKQFFNRKTARVAYELIGCFLCRKMDSKVYKYRITETEAYVGPHDLACHSSKGQTARNAPMWGEAGTIYVYFVYGMYFMLNIATEEKGFPAAVLIRGVEGVNGPGKLTKKLNIDKKLNGKKATPKNGLWFEVGKKEKIKVKRTPRIGVPYAGPIWMNKKYRFVLG